MEKTFEHNGSEIFYDISGEGKAVILLHGFAEDGSIWKEQADLLSKAYKLIIPHLPGSGKPATLSKEDAGIEDYADCLKALLDFENIDHCILLGHSMGGYITLAFAEKYSERLNAFGLVHSTAFADNEEKKSARRKGIEMMNEYGVYPFLKNTIPNLFSKQFKEGHPEKVASLIEEGKHFSKEALIQYYIAMMNRSDRTATLIKTHLPVLFVMGTEDVAAPLKDVLQQVHLPKIAHMHILENVGHMSMMEDSETLSKHLSGFLRFVSGN